MVKRKIAGLLIAVMATGAIGTVVMADEGAYAPKSAGYIKIDAHGGMGGVFGAWNSWNCRITGANLSSIGGGGGSDHLKVR